MFQSVSDDSLDSARLNKLFKKAKEGSKKKKDDSPWWMRKSTSEDEEDAADDQERATPLSKKICQSFEW